MRLDIQSLINLHPFFQEEQLLGWLRDEGELFAQSVESGDVAEVMGRIDRHATLEDVQRWPLREYLASGGHPMWFRSHVKSLMNQHLRRLNHSTLEKLRLPIPGGRHYVMPAAVGRRAGLPGAGRAARRTSRSTPSAARPGSTTRIGWRCRTRPKAKASPASWAGPTTTTPCGCIPSPTMTASAGAGLAQPQPGRRVRDPEADGRFPRSALGRG